MAIENDTIDERNSKMDRNRVFDCHLSPMTIKNTVSSDFFIGVRRLLRALLSAAYRCVSSLGVASRDKRRGGRFACRVLVCLCSAVSPSWLVSIGTASANSVEFCGIRPRMYIEDLL